MYNLHTTHAGIKLYYLGWHCLGKLGRQVCYTRKDRELTDNGTSKNINKKHIPDSKVQDFATCTLLPLTT